MRRKGELPRILSQRKAKKLLEMNGWTATTGGNHQVKMTKPGCRPITLPQHKGNDYAVGLSTAILRQAGLLGDDDRGED